MAGADRFRWTGGKRATTIARRRPPKPAPQDPRDDRVEELGREGEIPEAIGRDLADPHRQLSGAGGGIGGLQLS